jgi:hypothetical protein
VRRQGSGDPEADQAIGARRRRLDQRLGPSPVPGTEDDAESCLSRDLCLCGKAQVHSTVAVGCMLQSSDISSKARTRFVVVEINRFPAGEDPAGDSEGS